MAPILSATKEAEIYRSHAKLLNSTGLGAAGWVEKLPRDLLKRRRRAGGERLPSKCER
jgi:hypothetical protein